MVDQEKIHNQCLIDDPKERIHALEELKNFFSFMPDKQQAWDDLHRLTNDEDIDVRENATEVLGSAFSQMPDKKQAWNDLHRLTNDEDRYVRSSAAEAFGSAFAQVPDKKQAWNDLIKLTNDKDSYVRSSAAEALGSAFSQVPDKPQAWNDLHRLTNDLDFFEKSGAASVLGSAFSQVPDKKQAWNDLHRLVTDEYSNVRSKAAFTLGYAFSYVPDKQRAWNDLIKLTTDRYSDVRSEAVSSLGSAFSYVPDKQQAWSDLIKLTKDKDRDVRSKAASTLGYAFSYVPDKQQAWNDLIKLTNNIDWNVRSGAASALGSAFFYVPDKQQAWNDLHRLATDEDWDVRSGAASALGSSFSQVPDKQRAWNDLHKLATDEYSNVITYANHSLGRVSIFKASQAETDEDYKKELEKAIGFFETAAKEGSYYNPAQFCLPFYRSFHTIIFKKQEAREEVNKYLEEAKDAIKGSESKKQLFEAVQNLAEALKEVQNLETLDLQAMKDELNFYRKYCDHAAELMKCTDEKAPFATKVLRKGLPILDRNLKAIIEEIQEKAKNTYKQSQGTVTEEIAYSVCRKVQKLEMGSPEEMTQKVEDIAYALKKKIGYIPENEYVLNKIEVMRHERNLVKQYEALLFVIEQIPTITVVPENTVIENINKVGQELGTKLDGLSQEMNEIRIGLSPGITQEIEISSGIEISGTGGKLITTIPLQEISYAELKKDLQRIKGENISKLSELPKRLANRIKGYLLLKDREDIIEQLT